MKVGGICAPEEFTQHTPVTSWPRSADVTCPSCLTRLSPTTFGGLWTVVIFVSSMFQILPGWILYLVSTSLRLLKNIETLCRLKLVARPKLVASGFLIERLRLLFMKAVSQPLPATLARCQLSGNGTPLAPPYWYASLRTSIGVSPWLILEQVRRYSQSSLHLLVKHKAWLLVACSTFIALHSPREGDMVHARFCRRLPESVAISHQFQGLVQRTLHPSICFSSVSPHHRPQGNSKLSRKQTWSKLKETFIDY